MDERLERAPVGVVEVDADGIVAGVNDAARDVLAVAEDGRGGQDGEGGQGAHGDDADPVGAPVEEALPRSVEDSLVAAFDGAAVAAAEFEEYYPAVDRWLAVSVVPADGGGATVYLRDVTTRRRHGRALAELREERERTGIIDELLSAVLAELVDASSREEIAATITDRLGSTDRYAFAWVGEREVGGDDLVVTGVAGETGETFPAVRAALEAETATPEERAVERGQLQIVQSLAEDEEIPDAVRLAGFADGVQSALAVPLVYGSNVHGVVGIYAGDRDGFTDRERSSFETLGEVAGFAVTAARNRKLLLSDAVTELTLEVGAGAALADLAAAVDATIALDGLVPRGDGALLCYVTVEITDGADATVANEGPVADSGDGNAGESDVRVDALVAATDVPGVEDARAVGDPGSDGRVELTIGGSSPLAAVSGLGGTVRRASFEPRSGRVVVELPPDADVRRAVDAIGREHDVAVVAKRERERSVTTAREFRDELGERLTDRQEAVLRAAYLADYFESPRGSTAEEVAASLGITGSTLLYHLRAGQRKLLDEYFPEGTAARE